MNTLIINGHPRGLSFSKEVADTYLHAASDAGKAVQVLHLHSLTFNPNLDHGYSGNALEQDLIHAKEMILWADHLVWVYPIWWWGLPALLKGFIDRLLVPDFAFKYHKGSPFQEKLLKGKTAVLCVSMDGPSWYHSLFMRATGTYVMKKGILAFCGIRTQKTLIFDNFKNSSATQKQRWLKKVEKLART